MHGRGHFKNRKWLHTYLCAFWEMQALRKSLTCTEFALNSSITSVLLLAPSLKIRNINLENKQKNGYIRYNIGPNKPIMKLLNSRIRSKNPIFARLFLTEKLRNKQTRLVKLGNFLMEKLSSWGWSPWSSIEPLPLKWTNLGNSIWPSWKFDLTKKLLAVSKWVVGSCE